MNRVGRAAVMILLGLVMARLLANGSFGFFIQQRMRIPLLLATIVLIALGVYEGIAGVRQESSEPSSITRSTAPKVGWLMVLPLLVIFSVAPTGLGAAAAERVEAFTPVEPEEDFDRFEDLDTSNGIPELRVIDFVNRAIWDEDFSVRGETVRLEGLVVNDPDVPDGFLLTRFLVSCCAADGIPVQVAVRDVNQTFTDDTWVVADVVWREPVIPYTEIEEDVWHVDVDLVGITVDADPPTDAYESPYE